MNIRLEDISLKTDPEYLACSIGRFFGIPVRIYENGGLCCSYFPVRLPRDPMEICRKEILAVTEHVSYYVTPQFHYYGILNSGNLKIVIGPTAQITPDEQKLRELSFQADVPQDETAAFIEGMAAIGRMPVEMLLQFLCTLNHLLNSGEKLEFSDIAIHETEQTLLKMNAEERRTARVYEEDSPDRQMHNTLEIEETLMDLVRRGDTATLRSWLSSAPAVHGGTIARDQLRQVKNLFIVTATLTSRAAIRGGMPEDEAFTLSDAYIQRAELLSSYSKIINLQYSMLLEFTEQVEKLHRGKFTKKFSLDVVNYVRRHLSEPVSVERMAEEFFLSRPYLSAKFKQETGQTLTDYILSEKTEEAKRLLRYSDKPLSAISAYLGFSSHGHFSRVFRKYTGLTPREYRET